MQVQDAVSLRGLHVITRVSQAGCVGIPWWEVAEGRAGKKRRFGGDAGPCPWSQSGREREERVAKKDVDPIIPSFVC